MDTITFIEFLIAAAGIITVGLMAIFLKGGPRYY
jgi:hypothetical protein